LFKPKSPEKKTQVQYQNNFNPLTSLGSRTTSLGWDSQGRRLSEEEKKRLTSGLEDIVDKATSDPVITRARLETMSLKIGGASSSSSAASQAGNHLDGRIAEIFNATNIDEWRKILAGAFDENLFLPHLVQILPIAVHCISNGALSPKTITTFVGVNGETSINNILGRQITNAVWRAFCNHVLIEIKKHDVLLRLFEKGQVFNEFHALWPDCHAEYSQVHGPNGLLRRQGQD